jgi:hypothetical protein
MANNFTNTSLVTKLVLKEFLNAMQLGSKVDRQLDSQFKKVGASIDVRRPVMFTATSGATLGTAIDIEERSATVTLDTRQHVHFEITSQDETLSVEDMVKRYIRPAAVELVQKVESDIADEYKNIGNFIGTPGTTPSTFLSVANAQALLFKLGVPEDEMWCAFFNPAASVSLADGLKGVFVQDAAKKAIEKASIGMYGGFDLFRNNSLKSHTVGVATGTPLVNGATQNVTYAASGDAWTQSLITDGWTNDTTDILLAGDVITIAGVNAVNRRTREDTGDLATFTVTADATSGASTGPATVTISPPIITSGPYQTVTAAPADDAVITVKTGTGGTSYPQNLAFHPNAITLAMAPLDLPTDGVSAARESLDGISIRSARQYDITNDKTVFRFDILYGVKAQNPDMAVRITG